MARFIASLAVIASFAGATSPTLVPSPLPSATAEGLFFSAYVEGSSNDKAMGIYNPTGEHVILDRFAIADCFNGCTEEGLFEHFSPFPSGAGIESGAEYILCDLEAKDPDVTAMCADRRQFMGNGDDAFQLVRCGDVCPLCDKDCTDLQIVDSIGIFASEQVSLGWDACGIPAATKDHSLFRLPTICRGALWEDSSGSSGAPCEWVVSGPNQGFAQLGFHTTANCSDDGGRTTPRPSSEPIPAPTATLPPPAPVEMCASRPSGPYGDRRQNSTRLRLAHWNMDFLMLPTIDTTGSFQCPCPHTSCSSGECSGNCCGWGRVDAVAHLRYVATQLSVLDADIVHVVEVGDCGVLRELLSLLPPGHGYVPYMVQNRDTFTGQHVGLLSRIDPIEDVRFLTATAPYPVSATSPVTATASACATGPGHLSGSQGVTKNLVARFQIPGMETPVTIVGLHLLAIPDSFERCGKREAQALVGAWEAAAAIERGDEVIVVGDMNDFDGAVPQASGIEPVTNVLQILRSPGALRNIVELVPQPERYSEWWDQNGNCVDDGVNPVESSNEYSMLDHMLLSDGLWDSIIPGTAKVHRGWQHGMCLADGGLYSDHWPLLVDLNIGSENQADNAEFQRSTCDISSQVDALRASIAITVVLSVLVIIGVISLAPDIAPHVLWLRGRFARSSAIFSRARGDDEDSDVAGEVVMSSIHPSLQGHIEKEMKSHVARLPVAVV